MSPTFRKEWSIPALALSLFLNVLLVAVLVGYAKDHLQWSASSDHRQSSIQIEASADNVPEANNARVLSSSLLSEMETMFGLAIQRARWIDDLQLHEIYFGDGQMAYLTPDGDRLLTGRILDWRQGKDETQLALDSIYQIDPQTIPSEFQFIRLSSNEPMRAPTLWVFTDPACPFCRQLESQLDELSDVNVRYVPIAFLRSDRAVASVFCQESRFEAWRHVIFGGQVSQEPSDVCMEQAAAVSRFARGVGVHAAPTLMRADGQRLSGYMPAEAIRIFLAEPVVHGGVQ